MKMLFDSVLIGFLGLGGAEILIIIGVFALIIFLAIKISLNKTFGVILLLVGLCMVGFGIAALADVSTRNNSVEGMLANTFSPNYVSANHNEQIVGFILLGIGVILFIIGIIKLVSKGSTKMKEETENKESKKTQPIETTQNSQGTKNESTNVKPIQTETNLLSDELFVQIEKLGKLKEQGLITDEEFQEQKKKILK